MILGRVGFPRPVSAGGIGVTKPEKLPFGQEAAKRIAEIAGLDVDGARSVELAPQVQAIREGIDALDDLDLTDIEPATVSPLRTFRP
jgi:hypothetical protein